MMKTILKWAGLIFLGLAIFLVIAGLFVSSNGKAAIDQTYEVSASLISDTPSDSASLAHGEHLARTLGCFDCHGESLEGRIFVDAPPFLVPASNLTAGEGGIGRTYTVQDWDRTIRHGVKPSGQSVILMPSKTYHNLSDEDAADLIGFLQSIPAVDNELPVRKIRLLGRILAGSGAFDVSEAVKTSPASTAKPPEAPTKEYGDYLASLTCTACHGEDLRGGPPLDPNMPPPPDLSPSGSWSFEQFATAMRTGVTPSGHEMNPEYMPWTAFNYMTDEELTALHLLLQSL